ncbi:MAG: hypothetical protein AAGA48_15305 [Myxococcota bacterium]
MINLAISLGISLAIYGLVAAWLGVIAGVIPALIALGFALYGFGRRTSKAVEQEMKAIVPLLEGRKIDQAVQLIEGIKARHGNWQFGLQGQLDGQLGMIQYMQLKWDRALPLLEQGKFQNWTAHVCIGCIHYRKGNKSEAWASFERATGISRKETIIYLVWATLLERSGERTQALEVVTKGLEAQPDSAKLKEMKKKLANKKKIQTKSFGEQWYQFFPEEMAKQMMMRGTRGQPQQAIIQPRIGARGAPRR